MEVLVNFVTSPWIYAILIAMVLVDVAIPVLPSGTLLITASVYAVDGKTSVVLLILAAATASFCGDAACYLLGRHLSAKFFGRFGKERINRMQRILSNHGGQLMVVARFVPAGRTVAALSAAATEFPARRFYLWSAVAAVAWGSYGASLGYINGAWLGGTWLGLVGALTAATTLGIMITRLWRATERHGEVSQTV